MPKDSKSGSTAGSEGSFGSKNSKIAPAGPPPEIEESADEVDGNAVELVHIRPFCSTLSICTTALVLVLQFSPCRVQFPKLVVLQ
jgi:hypothetical protein